MQTNCPFTMILLQGGKHFRMRILLLWALGAVQLALAAGIMTEALMEAEAMMEEKIAMEMHVK